MRLFGLLADLEGGTPGPQDLEREGAEVEDFLEFIMEGVALKENTIQVLLTGIYIRQGHFVGHTTKAKLVLFTHKSDLTRLNDSDLIATKSIKMRFPNL